MKMREYKAGIMTGILILEDDLSIADLLQEALEAQGYSVIGIAGTVAEAMKIARQHQPDVTVVDVRLANGDLGTEFSAQLRKNHDCPVLFSTGSTDDPVLTKTDGDAVMIKPYLMNDVGRAITILLELRNFGRTSLPFPRSFSLLETIEA
jgi:DNA-binding response OmpR family regulator